MWVEIFRLELSRAIRRISIWGFALFFALAGYGMIWATLAGGGPLRRFTHAGSGDIHANAPYALYVLFMGLAAVALPITSAIFKSAALREFQHRTAELMFQCPVPRLQYLAGRFCAACTVILIITLPAVAGALLACMMPPTHPEKLGVMNLQHFINPVLSGILPLILRNGALFFGAALLFRRSAAAYTVFLIQFACFMSSMSLLALRYFTAAALLDPFGIMAARVVYGSWTLHQKNTLSLPFAGLIAANHLVWGAAGAVLIIVAAKRFHLQWTGTREKRKPHQDSITFNPSSSPVQADAVGVRNPSWIRHVAHIAGWSFRNTVMSIPFYVMAGTGVLFMLLAGIRNIGRVYDTPTLPVTAEVLNLAGNLFMLFLFIITAWAAGEMVWQDRKHGVHELTSSTAVSTSRIVAGKVGALMLLQTLLMTLILISGLIIQISQGYTYFELNVYALDLFALRLPIFIQLSVMALFLHAMAGSKLIGHFLVILVYVLQDLLPSVGLEHNVYNFAVIFNQIHSAMNGFGPYLTQGLLFESYWSAIALILICGVILLLPRELDTSILARIRMARLRFSRPLKLWLGAGFMLCLITGANVMIQTCFLHGFNSSADTRNRAAEFEKQFKQYESLPHPVITCLQIKADMYPSERRVVSSGTLFLENRSGKPVSSIMVQYPQDCRILSGTMNPQPQKQTDSPQMNVSLLQLDPPMLPGCEATFEYHLEIKIRGVPNTITDLDRMLVENGIFLDNRFLIPMIGYSREEELKDADRRLEYGLSPRPEMLPWDDPDARNTMIISPNAGWVQYEAVLSTAADQTAITSGELVSTWQQDGRRFFHYQMKSPCLLYFPFVSARYAVARSQWKDIPVEVYYHPAHETQTATMLDAAVRTLDYGSRQFGEYTFGVLRFAEFPRYQMLAESFPTLIPVSEGMGFMARPDPGEVNYVVRLIAHETAHEWWPHHVACANTEGMFFLTETLAQYTALKVVSSQYPPEAVNRYLKKRFEDYFQGRGRYNLAEMPLSRTGLNDYHVAYRKGMVVMNALDHYLGEDVLDGVLNRYYHRYGFQGPPFPRSMDLIEMISEVCPEDTKPLIQDLLQSIVTYELSIRSAVKIDTGSSPYRLKIEYTARRIVQTDDGSSQTGPVPYDIELAVLGRNHEPVYTAFHRLDADTGEIILNLNTQPFYVVIDPNRLLLDQDLSDNECAVF